MELLVYLAVHRDGVAQADIVRAIWPDVTPERAAQRLSTCLANLRSIIRQVRDSHNAQGADDGDTRVEPVLNTSGTYRLDPAIVTVDWWHKVDGYARATNTGTGSTGLAELRYTIGEALDSLAENSDYPWIDAEREHALRDLAQLHSRRAG
jgi:two-component SAPR family response regulator